MDSSTVFHDSSSTGIREYGIDIPNNSQNDHIENAYLPEFLTTSYSVRHAASQCSTNSDYLEFAINMLAYHRENITVLFK